MAFSAGCALPQASPEALARTIAGGWAGESKSAFESVFPFSEGREAFANSRQRIAGLADVIRSGPDQAVLLLSGVVSAPNSGESTYLGFPYSGPYVARGDQAGWRLEKQIPLDELGALDSHTMKVEIHPGVGLSVEDRMHLTVRGSNGFATRLNYTARIESVQSAGRNLHYLFGGALLWLDLPPGESDVTVRYSIDVPFIPFNTNSGSFQEAFGHVRNQFFWHPSLGVYSTKDWATFDIELRIPKDFYATTSLPQTDRIENAQRVIHGQTLRRASLLTLAYDRDWSIRHLQCGAVSINILAVNGSNPDSDAIGAESCSVSDFLAKHYGPPPGNQFTVVQARSWIDNRGWRFASNSIVVGSAGLGPMSTGTPLQTAPLGHEISHLWNLGITGPFAGFLEEGWAVWAESLIVNHEFGEEQRKAFWQRLTQMYFLAYDGKLGAGDVNGAIAYVKGPWIFKMLYEAVGETAFDSAMSEYFMIQKTRLTGWEDLAATIQQHSPPGFDARRFLEFWLTQKQAPHLNAEIKGNAVTIHTSAIDFALPLTIEVTTSKGSERRRVWIRGAETAVPFSEDVTDVKLNPDETLLIQ